MRRFESLFTILNGAVQKLQPILGLVLPTLDVLGATTFTQAPTGPGFIGAQATLTDGATVAVDAALASTFLLTCASNAAREISVPTNPTTGRRITVTIINTSGGNLTATTFAAAIKQPSLTLPATGTNREFTLYYDGTEWSIVGFSPANIPN